MSTEIVAKSEELRRLIVLVAGASAQVDSLVVKADEGLAADCTCNGETSPVPDALVNIASAGNAALLGEDEASSQQASSSLVFVPGQGEDSWS